MIASDPIITRDNRHFVVTGEDADRIGVILSSPVYAPDGRLAAIVSAGIRLRALGAPLDGSLYRLINDDHRIIAPPGARPVQAGDIAVPVHSLDPRSRWVLSRTSIMPVGAMPEYRAIVTSRMVSTLLIAAVGLLCLVSWLLGNRLIRRSEAQRRTLASHVEERTTAIRTLIASDPLTGLTNRAEFMRLTDEALAVADPTTPAAMMVANLDGFRRINESVGPKVADEALRMVGERIALVAAGHCVLGRLGADEFVIFAMNMSRQSAQALAAAVIREIARPAQIGGHTIKLRATIGIEHCTGADRSPDSLWRRAEVALDVAKREARGRAMLFEARMETERQERRQLEADLILAIGTDQFSLHYQPVVAAGDDALVGYEALVRWTHPVHGQLAPYKFIPVAEETGLIVELGAWIIRKACLDAASLPRGLKVSVNLSPRQFESGSLPLIIGAAIGQSGISPARLEFEITETTLLNEGDGVKSQLNQIRDLGAAIALDDFGTGYASLSYLRKYPFQKIKIDRSFVSDIGVGLQGRAIVKAVIDLAASLGMICTAEGIETQEQADALRSLGCALLQGYLFGKPEPLKLAATRATAAA
jgi:diguanylate cyclase (GGDEF)-like protein